MSDFYVVGRWKAAFSQQPGTRQIINPGRRSLRRTLYNNLALVAIAAACIAIWVVAPLKPFDECIRARKNADAYEALRKNPYLIVRIRVRTRLNIACAAHTADAYNSLLVVLSGAAVAVFTFTLYKVTRQLWLTGEAQRQLTGRQASISERQIDSTERLERPLLLVIPPKGNVGYRDAESSSIFPSLQIDFRNHGRSPAIIDGWHLLIVVGSEAPIRTLRGDGFFKFISEPRPLAGEIAGMERSFRVYKKMVPTNNTVAPGELLGWVATEQTQLSQASSEAIRDGDQRLWVDGIMIYRDVFDRERETRFRWTYDPGLDMLIRDSGFEFNGYT